MRLAALAVIALAGCAAPPAPPPSGMTLDGTGWTLATLDGAPVKVAAYLGFEGDRASGVAPCNRFMGGFAQTGARVTIGPIASTRMACPELDLEQRYLGALTDAALAEISGDRLILRGADGVELMTLTRDG